MNLKIKNIQYILNHLLTLNDGRKNSSGKYTGEISVVLSLSSSHWFQEDVAEFEKATFEL